MTIQSMEAVMHHPNQKYTTLFPRLLSDWGQYVNTLMDLKYPEDEAGFIQL